MTSVVFYFQVHQPYRLEQYSFLDIGSSKAHFNNELNRGILRRVADRCYVPMNRLLAELIESTDGKFRCAMSLSGTVLDQLEAWAPEALQSFVDLAETGAVEFLCETSQHSLAFHAGLGPGGAFERQVAHHRANIERLFGQQPTTFRNTELVISNDVARKVEELGFDVLLGEGADGLLKGRSPHHVYAVEGCTKLKLMLRDYLFSDDIAFRFSNEEWDEYPLLADVFARKLASVPLSAEHIGLFMDYETFGEHQSAETGLLDFMRYLPGYVLEQPNLRFRTPSEAAKLESPVETLSIPSPVSWADAERDLTAWLGNPMQESAHAALYALEPDVRRAAAAGHPELLDSWLRLTTSDHVYYMCTKFFNDGSVHQYFSPFDTPHDAFITFMNVLDDLTARVRAVVGESTK